MEEMTKERTPNLETPEQAEQERLVGAVMAAKSKRRLEFFQSDNPLARYLKEKHGSEVVEMTAGRRARHRRETERLVETLLTGVSPSGKSISELSSSYQRDLKFVAQAVDLPLPEKRLSWGPGTPAIDQLLDEQGDVDLAGGKAPAPAEEKKKEAPPVWPEPMESEEISRKERSTDELYEELFSSPKIEWPEPEEVTPLIAPEPRRPERRDVGMEQPEEILAKEVKLPPVEVPERRLIDLGQMWEGVRRRFRVRVDLKISERLKALGRPLSAEEAEAALAKQKAAAEARKEALRGIWERTGGAVVLPSAGAVKDWVDRVWAKASTPFGKLTPEEMEAGLATQKVEVQLPPRLKEISPKEIWSRIDKKGKLRLGIAVVLIAGGAGTAYEIEGRQGKDWQWLATQFSGIGAVTREVKATSTPEVKIEVTSIPPTTPTPAVTPEPEVVAKEKKVEKEAEEEVEIAVEEERAPEEVKSVATLIKEAWAAKQEAVQQTTEQLRQFVQTGVVIPEGSHPWKVSGQIAEQIIQGSGVEKTEGVLIVTTDAIKDFSGWAGKGEEAKPGDIVQFDPHQVAEHLAKAVDKISKVKAVEGELEVEVTDEDLGSLTREVEYLRGL